MKRILTVVAVGCLCGAAWGALGTRTVGAGSGGLSPFATDQFPGFDDLDKDETPEKKTPGWFTSDPEKDTAADQLVWAQSMEGAGELKAARRGYDALVRTWPTSPEAPRAQLLLAQLWENKLADYEEAFDAYDYLLDFYPRFCDYQAIVAEQYKLANVLVKERRTWLGLDFTSSRQLRRRYERLVRRAPGADWTPDALLKIADIREQDSQREEAVQVYAQVQSRFPGSLHARTAAYLEARARMHLARRLAYNAPRCRETLGYLKLTLRRYPDHERAEEMRGWAGEIETWLSEDDWQRAKFYDSRMRTLHAARASYEKFVKEHPDSAHAEEARARIAEIDSRRSEKVNETKEEK